MKNEKEIEKAYGKIVMLYETYAENNLTSAEKKQLLKIEAMLFILSWVLNETGYALDEVIEEVLE